MLTCQTFLILQEQNVCRRLKLKLEYRVWHNKIKIQLNKKIERLLLQTLTVLQGAMVPTESVI